ncbi:MazG nucleotide pyrophosphohydrolase domain-containing protein [Cytobacillus sp. IB215316]|uniref:MazG nucleotide pyrophosphohydrolase domain-containing protein n=1 Tax=Cytobacillus sp. IB215316 TaxID=3097354 RepID=UPI002A128515|nr:MazG nucleotide pyrophosphohydrolase domain-containing protein [Cytobacillus sp. IB215316]MDX8362079.1 MazG nucleotide pyrophosphohydrolase domain-containing protein [Cytobacillus sp. IB215316]
MKVYEKSLLKLVEEVGELSEVILKVQSLQQSGTIEEELYDVLYYVIATANIYDIDLTASFHLQVKINITKYTT